MNKNKLAGESPGIGIGIGPEIKCDNNRCRYRHRYSSILAMWKTPMERHRCYQLSILTVLWIIFLSISGSSILAKTLSVRLNQVGYPTAFPKRATIVDSSTMPLDWQLKTGAGKVVASGLTIVYGKDAASGDHVHIADFTSYAKPGVGYTLHAGTAGSHPFSIGDSVFNILKYDALAYFYHNRSGIAIALPYAGSARWARAAGHVDAGPNQGDTDVPCAPDAGCSYRLDVRGGWYDAGDQGKYVVNGGIAVWTLLNQYERARHFGSLKPFADGRLSIPENANSVHDLLDEARWEVEFLLRMQVPGNQPKAGMVHHKVHDANWTPLPTRPDLDPQPRQLRPPSTAATLNLAAVAAQSARIWKDIDKDFAARCLSAAEVAWAAAVNNPVVYAPFTDGTGGGAYADNDVSDEFYWAAAELFITTGKSTYQDHLLKSPHHKRLRSALPSNIDNGATASMTWNTVEALGSISLAVVPNLLAPADITAIRKSIIAGADVYLSIADKQGYGLPLAHTCGYPWGSNSFVLNNGIIMALAYEFTKSSAYLHGAAEALNYVLGRNPMDQSYVSGYGSKPLQNPHHRFWAHQKDVNFPPPYPGAVSGGPNSALQDPIASSRLKGCAPQKCFVDDIESYSTNEVAINWNAPLAWLAAFLDEKAQQ
jgi:endoglucanase